MVFFISNTVIAIRDTGPAHSPRALWRVTC